jgi:hypothetical protein
LNAAVAVRGKCGHVPSGRIPTTGQAACLHFLWRKRPQTPHSLPDTFLSLCRSVYLRTSLPQHPGWSSQTFEVIDRGTPARCPAEVSTDADVIYRAVPRRHCPGVVTWA